MNENRMLGLAWISPYIIGLIVFTAFPFVSSFFLSFTEYDLMSPPVFNGIENYRYMLTEDGLFWKSMGVTFAYVFLTIPLKLAFALGIAFVLNFKLRGIGFFRTAYYIPSILGSSVAIAVLWRALFAIDGLLNSFIGVLGFDPVNWLGEPSLALMSVTLLRVWQFGSAMVIFLAALQNVPQSQYEAAMIDGASKWQSVYEGHGAADHAGDFLQLHHADHSGVPGVYRPVRHHRRRPNLLHLSVLALYLRHRL